jgi:4-amino-4-deoxy-L-arabinose transferase-like glycosyltransferase
MLKLDLKNLYIAIFVLSVFRLLSLYINLDYIDMYIDETYYWGWAQSFEFGYYSKPPMVAWLIMITTSLFGDGELAIKIGSILVYPITTIVIYKIALELFDEKIAFYSAILFFTLPSIWLSSMIISTDVVLLLFWSLTILFFVRALKGDATKDWVIAGIFAGFGLLSKYNMIFFLISVFLILGLFKDYRKYLKSKNLYITMAVAVVVFLPNLYWQYTHDFVSFAHTGEISQVDRELFHPNKMFEFLGSQFGIFGPITFGIFLYTIYKYKSLSQNQKIFFWFSVPFIAIITTLSLMSRAFANWAAPTYIGATILVVSFLVYNKKENLIKYSIIIHTFLAIVVYYYNPVIDMLNIKVETKKYDPFKRVKGWQEAGVQIQEVLQKYPNTRVLFNSRQNMAQLIYYIPNHPFDSVIFNHFKKSQNHYHITTDMNKYIGDDFVLVATKGSYAYVDSYFDKKEKIADIHIDLYKDFNRDFEIFYLTNFKGY